jgi:hypothetical protein
MVGRAARVACGGDAPGRSGEWGGSAFPLCPRP